MNRFIIALLVVVGLVVSILPLTEVGIRQGFRQSHKSWAPGIVYFGARVWMRCGRYQVAVKVLDQATETWPKYRKVSDAAYWVALCCERSGSTDVAIVRYRAFLARYPRHRWAAQAQRRLNLLEAQGL